MERKMASIQMIDNILPIEGADAIEAAVVGGWKVVVKKGEYTVGDTVVYCEIDSWIPNSIAPFLTKPEHFPKVYNGVLGERLRTVKLRGQVSQGLILPLSVCEMTDSLLFVGLDVSVPLGIQKWEAPEDTGKASEAKGSFPHFIRKTDQERVQNLRSELIERQGGSFEVTVKRDGSSCTAYVFDGEIGVCSRNINLKEVEGNGFWDVVKKNDIHTKIIQTGRNLAVQGELIAPNIQGNYEKVVKPEFHCFSIFDIDKQEYLLPQERRSICNTVGIPHIKVLDENFILNHSCDDLLAYAEGDGVNSGVKREGVVFKSNTDQFSFKAVSNSYLLKKG